MAVAVRQAPFLVLDESYRIVGVGPAAEAWFGPLAGQVLWDCFAGSEPLFRPHYDTARRTGEPVEFVQFYDGHVARIRAVPAGDRLALYWEALAHLDVLTIDGLRSSIDEAVEVLNGGTGGRRGPRAHRGLRVIEGRA